MHETDMTKALIFTVKDWLAEQPAHPTGPPKVERVHLTVGEFTCVEPASLQFAFRAQTQGTFLSEAELVIKETPLIAFCHRCQQEYRPEIGLQYVCPTCQAPMDDILSGRELKINRVEFSQPVAV
ncbi:MAG: hydrogenase maturation nickel metallochaperone HypA [Phormidesmis sp. RL_2_1]|nr:hydrogenase maturation nickel metallochaperone HypA [Phormidesmis sp. RL_2_1]